MAVAAPSFDDYFNLAKAEAQNRQPALTFYEGDISEFLCVSGAAMADHLTGYTAQLFKNTYLDGAVGDDLTTLADDRYGIVRNPALAAFGTVAFSRSSDSAGLGTIAAGTLISTQIDAQGNTLQFTTGADVNFGATDLGPLSVDVTAVNEGSDGNAAANTITKIASVLFDPLLTVTNAATMAGGVDEESDIDLRQRVRDFPVTIRRGTVAALEYGALQVSGVTTSTALTDESGLVTVYVSDSSGNSNPTMITDVTNELFNWVAAGASYTVVGGSLYNPPNGLAISISLNVRAGVDTAAIALTVKQAIVARLALLKIGETCYRAQIQQAALNVDQSILGCTVITPSTDVTSPGQLIHTSIAAITVA